MPRAPRRLRSGSTPAHPYATSSSRLSRTPGARPAAPGHTRVDGLEEMVNPAKRETWVSLKPSSAMPSGMNVSGSGGYVEYLGITAGQRHGVVAVVTRSMLRTGSAARYSFPFITSLAGLLIVRGHLLARVLGGSGSEARNLVPLYHHRTNLPMYRDFEQRVQNYVQRGGTVRVEITPYYRAAVAALSVFPAYIEYRARDELSNVNVLPQPFLRIPAFSR
jgi:hypothetical protein